MILAYVKIYIKNKIMTRNVFTNSHFRSDLLLKMQSAASQCATLCSGGVSDENALLGRRERVGKTAETAGTFSSLIGLQHFERRSEPNVGVWKNITFHNRILYVILMIGYELLFGKSDQRSPLAQHFFGKSRYMSLLKTYAVG